MTTFDKGIPIPKSTAGKLPKWHFGDMEAGDSFVIAKEDAPMLRSSASWWKHRHPGWDYVTRREGNGVRVWCTATATGVGK